MFVIVALILAVAAAEAPESTVIIPDSSTVATFDSENVASLSETIEKELKSRFVPDQKYRNGDQNNGKDDGKSIFFHFIDIYFFV